jgi:hypothetical protein
MLAATSWIAARLVRLEGADPASAHLRTAGRFALSTVPARAAWLREEALAGAERLGSEQYCSPAKAGE